MKRILLIFTLFLGLGAITLAAPLTQSEKAALQKYGDCMQFSMNVRGSLIDQKLVECRQQLMKSHPAISDGDVDYWCPSGNCDFSKQAN